MFNIENAIKEWKKSLRRNEALEDGYIAELESHLRDEIDKGIKDGKSEEAAFNEAIKRIGQADLLGEEYYKTDTTHINKRPPWKESRWVPVLLSNHLKVARRNISRQKGYSFINITGLAMGMACSIVLLLWVYHQNGFDKFHKNYDNIFRLEFDAKSPKGSYRIKATQYPAGPTLKDNIPEVKTFARLYSPGSMLVKYKDNSFYETTISGVDPSFLEMFSFPLLSGDPKTALGSLYSMVLSETMAKKYFGNENPIGKSILINNKYSFSVTGIIQDSPQNSTIRPEILIPLECLKEVSKIPLDWHTNFVQTWVQVSNINQLSGINKKITDLLIQKTIGDDIASIPPSGLKSFLDSHAPDYFIVPLKNIHLYGVDGYGDVYGEIQSVKIFITLAFFILLIACINYMNLATARATSRAKEVGLRKTVGAERKHIIGQFFGESLFLSFISFILSLIIVILLLPLFNDLMETRFSIGSLFSSGFFIVPILVALIAGLLSGSYPALFLSSFSPVKVLRGGLNLGMKNNFFRKSLVIFQFCLSVILIVGAIVAFQQLEFLRSKKVGYEKDHLIYLPLRGETVKSYTTLKAELLKTPNILNVSGMSNPPTSIRTNSDDATWEGKDPNNKPLVFFGEVDFDFVETMIIEMIEGRPFSNSFSADSINSVLVNEEALKIMGLKSGIGKVFRFLGNNLQIVGVMKNFHFTSAQQKIEPLVIGCNTQPKIAVIRLKGGNINTTIENVKSVWQKIAPLYPFEYKFVDEEFAKLYKSDEQIGNIFKYGSIFAIIIASLGLFGFSSYMAEKRKKEIGIRKTLGASINGITILLSKEFIKWVLIANVIAWPIAYMLMNSWLQDYAYRISIQWWVFAVSGIATVLIAVLTVGYQAVKAASANPVKSLKCE